MEGGWDNPKVGRTILSNETAHPKPKPVVRMSRADMIKDIQRLILRHDYSVSCVFKITDYIKENLETNLEWIRKRATRKKAEVEKMDCPMCGLPDKHQIPDPDNLSKSWCKGCGVKFYDRGRE